MLGLGNKKSSEVRQRAYVGDDPSFRRTHTISGYDPSVALEKTEAELERKKLKKMQNRRRRLAAMLVCVLAIIIIGFIGLFQYLGVISNVNSSNQITAEIDKSRYISVADIYFREHPIERFSFVLNNQSFSDHMSKNIKEIENATINNRGFLSGELNIKVREPVAIWRSGGEKHFIDGNGVVFDINLMADPGIIIEDNTLGTDTVLPVKFLRFIGQVISGIQKNGGEKVEKASIPNKSIRSVEIFLSGRPYPIKTQIDRDISSQVGDILNILKYLDGKNIVPGEYIDTRVESKAYWK